MAKGFKHGAGGGVPLNFKVVGGTAEPANPQENTIWVNTAEIKGWVFSAAEPETPSDDMVWICVGTTSAAEFNALKKNNITVYPLSAKQYVSGAWIDVIAKTRQNGAWVEWLPEGTLYLEGNECTYITGGWRFDRGLGSDYGKGTGVHNENNMEITIDENWESIQAATTNKIELSKYSKLCCQTSGAAGYLQYGSSISMGEGLARKAISKSTSKRTTTLDISSATADYYVAIQTSTVSNAFGTLTIHKVWLE